MSKMKVCPNGHMYDATLERCPYCPGADSMSETIVSDVSSDANATLVDSRADATMVDTQDGIQRSGSKVDHKATMIMKPEESDPEDIEMSEQRKLVGWLACYTWDSFGKSYEIREGKTSIGADQSSSIQIDDPGISANHAQLLFRGSKLRIKDSFSTNGTFVNGKDIEADPRVLEDGDEISIGRTSFRLRLVDGGE